MIIDEDATYLYIIGYTNVFSPNLLNEIFYAKINVAEKKV
jgi:hypothetical protein